MYSKDKNDLAQRLNELVGKIRHVKKENEIVDKNIDELSLSLSELKSKIDYSLPNKLKLFNDTR